MKRFLSVLLVCLMFVLYGCSLDEPVLSEENNLSSNPKSEVSSNSESENSETNGEASPENYDAALDEWVKNLEPMQIFETEKEYPAVILEIFDIMMAQETDDFLKSEELLGIGVSGGENEFCADYSYIGKEGSEESLLIRVRKLESGEFALVARGGGPLAYGLEKSELTLEDISGTSSGNSYIKTEICPHFDIGHDGGTLFSGGKLYISAMVHRGDNSAEEKLIIDLETGQESG